MINELAKNIAAYRKRLNMTQEELAKKLSVSFQAVSKWENGQSMPDITLLGDIAAALDSDLNGLMGYSYSKKRTLYEDRYADDAYYWGVAPSNQCFEVMKQCPPTKKLRLLDVGCGEGRNAAFFARNGYAVDAFDISASGVEKTRRLAESCGVAIHAFQADLMDYRLEQNYDVVFSCGVLHYIPEELRREILTDYQNHTAVDGVHALNVFVRKPFIAPAPDGEPSATVWRSGELATYYSSWLLHEMSEKIFDCNSSGEPHRHCMDTLLARKKAEK